MGWPKLKGKNQRLRPRNVLAVRSSTAPLRRSRFRLLFHTSAASLAVFFVLYLCWRSGQWLLNRFIYQNSAYALQTLDVRTDGVIALDQIRRWAGVRPGENLFAIDLARIKRDLELVPAIQGAAVERLLPQTLRISVQEREPVAQIVTALMHPGRPAQSVSFLLDAEGWVMLPLESRQRAVPFSPAEQYPLITGVRVSELSPGRRVESPQIRLAMRFIAAFAQSPMAGLTELRRVDVSSPEVLTILTDQQSEVSLGVDDLERQLGRWRIVHEVGARQGRQIASLDLSVRENIPLRWLEAPPVPSSAPKTKKTSPYKKKHA